MAARCTPRRKVTPRWRMPPCQRQHRCCTLIPLKPKLRNRSHLLRRGRKTAKPFPGSKAELPRVANGPWPSELPHQRASNYLGFETDVVNVARRDSEILVAIIGVQIFDTADQIFRKGLIDAGTDRPTHQQLFVLDRPAVFPELELRQRKSARGIDQGGRHHGNANPGADITAQVHIICIGRGQRGRRRLWRWGRRCGWWWW